MRKISDREIVARLDNIDRTLMQIASSLPVKESTTEIKPGSPAISMIARELVNSPDLYLHKRKMGKH